MLSYPILLGWVPGTQYVYNYSGRSVAGIHQLKQQNAVIELQSRVVIQSTEESTLIVKVPYKLHNNLCFSIINRTRSIMQQLVN